MDEIMEYQGRLYFMPSKKNQDEKSEELLEFCDLIAFPQTGQYVNFPVA